MVCHLELTEALSKEETRNLVFRLQYNFDMLSIQFGISITITLIFMSSQLLVSSYKLRYQKNTSVFEKQLFLRSNTC